MYTIIFSDKAIKQLKKLELNVQERILNSLDRIKVRPEKHVQRLTGINAYKLRVGNYRVIMDIEQSLIQIHVIKIGHRKNVYEEM